MFFSACLSAFAVCLSVAVAPRVSITEIQGALLTSPFAADSVTTSGIVTAVTRDGFFLQDPVGDADDATSDAVFIYTGVAPSVIAGDDVRVEGVVHEYLPGNDPSNLTVTEFDHPRVFVTAHGRALPSAIRLALGARRAPADIHDAIAFYESLEGMRVTVPAPRVVQATNVFGEVWVVPGGLDTSPRGALAAGPDNAHPERVQLDDARLSAPMPRFEVGDMLGDVTGVVTYSFGNYELLVDAPPVKHGGTLSREVTTLARAPERVRIASFNLHNLAPADVARMDEIARVIVSHLDAPEIIGVEEIQDDSGPLDDGTVDASTTLSALTSAIRRADGPAYDFREVLPANNQDGGEPGGNIRVAFLFDPARVAFVDHGDSFGSADTRVVNVDGRPRLTRSPGRIDPANDAWKQSRKPLAGEFIVDGHTLFVIACHFVSQTGSTSLFGATQPPFDPGSVQRLAQAQRVERFVSDILAIDANARVVVLGDLNDDWFSAPIAALETTPLAGLWSTIKANDRYSLLFDGLAQEFDHILVSPALANGARFDIVHVAAEFADGVSDHDCVIASVRVREPDAKKELPRPAISEPTPNPFNATVRMNVTGAAHVDIFDVAGRKVTTETVVDGATTWSGKDDAGRDVPAGVYFVRVSDGVSTRARKLVLIR
ncbi:MAG TPA: endonuclease/exonuclease/phosphatase family protein [Candidatus Krumholzibacteria bacterium]|nr:endonuclease/exonuclease/phosphatase family protein [Candidatus Krumholzibacteria bacterium]